MQIKLINQHEDLECGTRLNVTTSNDTHYIVTYRNKVYQIVKGDCTFINTGYDKDKHKKSKQQKNKSKKKIKVKGKKNGKDTLRNGGKMSPLDSKKIKDIYNPR